VKEAVVAPWFIVCSWIVVACWVAASLAWHAVIAWLLTARTAIVIVSTIIRFFFIETLTLKRRAAWTLNIPPMRVATTYLVQVLRVGFHGFIVPHRSRVMISVIVSHPFSASCIAMAVCSPMGGIQWLYRSKDSRIL
jgi:hypothetical protein